MFYIEPTHKEELRKKQGVRLVAEEFLIDIGFVLTVFSKSVCNVVDSGYLFVEQFKGFVIENKEYSVVALIALLLLSAMVF